MSHTLKKAKTKKPLYTHLVVLGAEKSLNFSILVLTGLLYLVQFVLTVAAFEKYKYVERSSWAKKEKEKGLLLDCLRKKNPEG